VRRVRPSDDGGCGLGVGGGQILQAPLAGHCAGRADPAGVLVGRAWRVSPIGGGGPVGSPGGGCRQRDQRSLRIAEQMVHDVAYAPSGTAGRTPRTLLVQSDRQRGQITVSDSESVKTRSSATAFHREHLISKPCVTPAAENDPQLVRPPAGLRSRGLERHDLCRVERGS